MFARAPASSANLGPGFDTLAIALALYVEVTIEDSDALRVESSGAGAGRFDDEEHLAVRVARDVLGHSNFAIRVESSIPLSRGLGSSASLAVAAAAAAGATDPLAVATRFDEHAENAAASVLGGLVTASLVGGEVLARRLALDESWRFVAVIPDQELPTADARRVLPSEVPFADAVANLNAMGLLIAGLAHRGDFVASAMDDVLHQPYRMGLLPFASSLLLTLRESGAAASCWSGAGSTMLALVAPEYADGVAAAAHAFLREHSLEGNVLVLDADREGLVTR